MLQEDGKVLLYLLLPVSKGPKLLLQLLLPQHLRNRGRSGGGALPGRALASSNFRKVSSSRERIYVEKVFPVLELDIELKPWPRGINGILTLSIMLDMKVNCKTSGYAKIRSEKKNYVRHWTATNSTKRSSKLKQIYISIFIFLICMSTCPIGLQYFLSVRNFTGFALNLCQIPKPQLIESLTYCTI